MRTIVITGASSGVGENAARQLATTYPDDRFILVGRNPERTKQVAESIGAQYFLADYAKLDDIRQLAVDILAATDRIDVLANNAGGLFDGPVITDDGFERMFQVNHLAPMLLTHELFPTLLQSNASIVATASMVNMMSKLDLTDLNGLKKFRPFRNYANSKLANILFTKELHSRFHDRGINTVAYHPGIIRTNFTSNSKSLMNLAIDLPVAKLYATSPEQAGTNLAYFIDGTPGIMWESGQYYDGTSRKVLRFNKRAKDPGVATRHFDLSSDMLGISWDHFA